MTAQKNDEYLHKGHYWDKSLIAFAVKIRWPLVGVTVKRSSTVIRSGIGSREILAQKSLSEFSTQEARVQDGFFFKN